MPHDGPARFQNLSYNKVKKMAVTTYTVINGEAVSQVSGGVRLDYLPDPLGSTVALLDNAQNFSDTFEYWPYGEPRTRTGVTSTPFQFVGTLGYYRDTSVRTYVRARHYKPVFGHWMTMDPYWPTEPSYVYSVGNPLTLVDFDGKQKAPPPGYGLQPWPPYEPPFAILPIFPYPIVPRPFKFGYMNWCGRDRPGPGHMHPEPPPVDEVDKCCRCHDKDLGNCDCGGYSGSAHHNMIRCLKNATCRGPWKKECEEARNLMIRAFTLVAETICNQCRLPKAPPCSPTPPPPDCPPFGL